MVVLTAHQPVYLPWLGLLHKIALSDRFCIFDGVQYLKKDWNNRNKIKTKDGDLWLSVPVLTTGHFDKPILEIEINNTTPWRRKHWQTLQMAYRKAPFFSKYADFFEHLYEQEWTHLVPLNNAILVFLLEQFGIKVEMRWASDEGFVGSKSDLVLDMCRKLDAGVYIFGALGRDYANVEDFQKSGIQVYFQDYKHPEYSQLHGPFISHLSAVDLLFNHGPDSYDIMMRGNVGKSDLLAEFNHEMKGALL